MPHQLPPGTVLNGKYVIGKTLGQGGFGITYLGWDLVLDTRVAIKEYYPSGAVTRNCTLSRSVQEFQGPKQAFFDKGKEKFVKEARILAKFSGSPQIVQVRNFFQENNTAYIVMEFLAGITLKDYTGQCGGKITARELLPLLKPIITALGEVHKAGLIHRDISPDNLMLMPNNTLKLLDFGAADPAVNEDERSRTVLLKYGYTPPEQYLRHGNLGPWTDVYALCATVCYCLTGTVPPDALERQAEDRFVLPMEAERQLTANQKATLKKGLAVNQKDRLQSMQELYDGFYKEESPAPGPPAPDPPNPGPKPSPDPNPDPKPGPPSIKEFLNKVKSMSGKYKAACVLALALLLGIAAGGIYFGKNDRDRFEVTEYERGISNGNAVNFGEFCINEELSSVYFINSGGALCQAEYAKTKMPDLNTVNILLDGGAKYLNVMKDGMFYYKFADRVICRANPDGSGEEVLTEARDQVTGLSAVRDSEGERLYYIEREDREDGLSRVISMGFDGSDQKVLLEGTASFLNVSNGYLYYVGGSQKDNQGVWKMRADGANAQQLYSGSAIVWLQVYGDEVYMLSKEGKSLVVTDLEGVKLRELAGIDCDYPFHCADDWIYYTNLAGKLCKRRLDGSGVSELWEYPSKQISIANGYLYLKADKGDGEAYYLLSADGGEDIRVNPLGYDYMRGNTAANLANGGHFWGSKLGGVHYFTNTAGNLYETKDGAFIQLYDGVAESINVDDEYVYFASRRDGICRWSIESRSWETVLDVQADNLSLVNDMFYFHDKTENSICRMKPEEWRPEVLYKANESSTRLKMLAADGNIYFVKDYVLYKMPYDGEPEILYEKENVYRIEAWNQKLYVEIAMNILTMDYNGNILGSTGDSGPYLLHVLDDWIYLHDEDVEQIKRINEITGEEEVLVTGAGGLGDVSDFNIMGVTVWFLFSGEFGSDGNQASQEERALSITLGSGTCQVEDCYSVDNSIIR